MVGVVPYFLYYLYPESDQDRYFVVPKHLIAFVLASCSSLFAAPSLAQEAQISFTGTVLPQCAIVMTNGSLTTNNPSFKLIGNQGAITTVCNTSSILSVTIDKNASLLTDPNTKIRFATGGTGIYAGAGLNSNYQDTASYSTNGVTSAIGDTAQIETNSSAPSHLTDLIVVYASLTPQ